jgi:hypothetical protein
VKSGSIRQRHWHRHLDVKRPFRRSGKPKLPGSLLVGSQALALWVRNPTGCVQASSAEKLQTMSQPLRSAGQRSFSNRFHHNRTIGRPYAPSSRRSHQQINH